MQTVCVCFSPRLALDTYIASLLLCALMASRQINKVIKEKEYRGSRGQWQAREADSTPPMWTTQSKQSKASTKTLSASVQLCHKGWISFVSGAFTDTRIVKEYWQSERCVTRRHDVGRTSLCLFLFS